MKARKEQIIKILNDIIEPVPLKTKEAIADAILALPIEVPGDDDIEKKANGIANPKSHRDFERGEWLGVKEGARWAIDEIIKRNRP